MISIVVVGYNSQKYLSDCLKSIYASTFKRFRVIFVDNNSQDDSLDFIRTNFQDVLIIKNKKNSGFAGGNNLGIKKALSLGSDYIMLLNPDTIIDKDCLKNLIDKSNKNTILQPLILLHINGEKTNLINTTGGVLNFLGFSYCNDYRKNRSVAKEKDISLASGAAIFIPSSILKKIGLFDEDFFMYHEDVDLSWRARMVGFNIMLIPKALVWHKYSFSRNQTKLFYSERNRIVFLLKNFSLKYLLLISPIFLVNEILMLCYSLINGWPKEKIKSWVKIVKNLSEILCKRKSVLNTKNEKEGNLKKFIVPIVSFSEIRSIFFLFYNIFLKFYWGMIRIFI